MANSYLLYTGNGSTTQYSLSGIDGWISTGFLKVYFNDNANPEATNTYTFVDLTTSPKIQFNTAPANNTIIRIQRETPATVSLFRSNVVDFEDTSILTAADLDKSVQGVLHVVQEANDTGSGALPPTADGAHWNAENKRITNTSNPQDLEDVATKGYVDALTLYGGAATTPQAWTFSGDSTTTNFTFSPAALSTDPAMFIVEVGGTLQRPTTDYTVTSSTLSFVSAPPTATNNIRVRNLGIARNVINEVRIGTTNTGVGNAALDSITIGTNNTAVGSNALTSAGAAYANAAVGQQSMPNNLTGSWNAAFGQRSLFSNTSGTYNTAVGRNALQNSTTGSENVAVGNDAGSLTSASASVATVNNSIAIGSGSKFNADGETNQIVIGYNAVGAGSNTTTIGNSSTTNTRIPNGNLTVVSGNLAVSSGNATISGTLGAGASTLASLGVTNNATVGGTLNVTGATTLGAVGTGAATLASLGVTNNATVGGTLGVTGVFTASGGLGGTLLTHEIATVSGTEIDCTSIPSWARRIMVAFVNLSTNGTSALCLRVGQGSIATSGYSSRVNQPGVAWENRTDCFIMSDDPSLVAANAYSGHIMLTRMSTAGNVWLGQGAWVSTTADSYAIYSGFFSLGSTMIDRVRLTTLGGVNTFDLGNVVFQWE